MVRRTLLRSRRQGSARTVAPPAPDPEIEFKAKKEAYLKSKKDFDDACVKKHGKPSICSEMATALKLGLKGTGTVVGHVARAGATMGEMTLDDLYKRSPQGERDRAIVKAMMEKENSTSSRKSGSSRRNDVLVYIDGKPRLVDKRDVPALSKRRR